LAKLPAVRRRMPARSQKKCDLGGLRFEMRLRTNLQLAEIQSPSTEQRRNRPNLLALPLRATMLDWLQRSKGMKNCKLLAGIFFCRTPPAAFNAPAQFGSPTDQSGLNAAMLKVFGDIKDFTSDAEVRMSDKSGADAMTMVMTFQMLD